LSRNKAIVTSRTSTRNLNLTFVTKQEGDISAKSWHWESIMFMYVRLLGNVSPGPAKIIIFITEFIFYRGVLNVISMHFQDQIYEIRESHLRRLYMYKSVFRLCGGWKNAMINRKMIKIYKNSRAST